MISTLLSSKRFIGFSALCLTVCLFGCGKKQPPQSSPSAQASNSVAPASPNASAATPTAAAAPAASPSSSYDAQVTARSIDYLRGQVFRKNWDQARMALSQLEGRSLTAAQRQYVDSLKAQLPPK